MKIRHRIVLILVLGLAACIVLSVVFKLVVNNKRKNLLTKQYEDTRNISVPKALEINYADIKSHSYDYTAWDQMVNYIQTKDSTWAKEELDNSLYSYQINVIWVLDSNLKQIYYSTKNQEKDTVRLGFFNAALKEKLSQSYFQNFFIRSSGRLYELHIAPIQPTRDIKRESPPHGYLILGKSVDASYIAALHKIAPEISFTLKNDIAVRTPVFNIKNSDIKYDLSLNSITGETLGVIQIERNFSSLTEFNNSINYYLLCFISIVFLLCIGFYQLARRLIVKPIASISKAVHQKDGSYIIPLSKSKTEYGELCTQLINSFDYNEQLSHEIEIRKQSEEALQKTLGEKLIAEAGKAQAESSAKAKSQFLSTMSHEIRTPINGVIGIANLLMEEDLSYKQKEYVSTLNFSANHLLSLVSDILDFSKIEAGSLHFEKASFNLEKLCQSTFDLFRNKAEEKQIAYRFVPSSMKDHSLYGDSTRLSQVIANLLSNAIKFTEKGFVEFGYEVLVSNNHNSTICFKVTDSGIGIDPDKIHKVFESFAQADESVTRQYGGTGLGLTISKKIIELQGGSIKVDSMPGRGSVFTFTLTFDNHVYKNKEFYEQTVDNTARKELPGMKVLVAEDNPVNAMVLTRFLNKWKIESKVAVDGSQAITMIEEDQYDVVLMDLQMPNIDGVEATRIIRQSESEKTKDITIVAFTADALLETQRKLVEQGFDYCITKPFNPDQLFRYLKKQYLKAS
jgi:signal transduction histidine kinase/CheY-like chemotaxis protein